MASARLLPEGFVDLEPFVPGWAVTTLGARHRRRLETTHDERRAFYDAMHPRLGDALAYVDKFPLHALPGEARNLLHLALTLAEISLSIEVYTTAFETKMRPNSARMRVTREIDGL